MKFTQAIILLLASIGIAFAGTDATFNGLYDTLEGWSTGSLGKTISAAMFLTGMGWAVYKRSVITAVIDVALIIAFNTFPLVLGTFMAATI